MWQKLLNILLILSAITILGVSIYVNKKTENVVEQHQEQDVDKPSNGEENIGGGVLPTDDEVKQSISNEEIQTYIQEVFGVDFVFGLNTAICESRLRVDAVSPSGKYIGLYQFDNNTFYSNCDGDIGSWKDQVVCAKKLYDKGETWRWPNCP